MPYKDYMISMQLELVRQFGPEFADNMISKLTAEANSYCGNVAQEEAQGYYAKNKTYKNSEAVRSSLFSLVAVWKEALVLHDLLKSQKPLWELRGSLVTTAPAYEAGAEFNPGLGITGFGGTDISYIRGVGVDVVNKPAPRPNGLKELDAAPSKPPKTKI